MNEGGARNRLFTLNHTPCHAPSPDQEKMQQLEEEERALKEENIRLQRRLQRETERREQLSRQLSESESSLEMDDERCVWFTVVSCPAPR